MRTYKVTFTYRAPNGFLRSSSIIVDANNESHARIEALKLSSNYDKSVITKVSLYGDQGELPVNTEQPKPKSHSK